VSNTDLAILENNKLSAVRSIPSCDYSNAALKEFVSENTSGSACALFACTGGKRMASCSGFKRVDEIQSIGLGAALLSGDKKFLAANVGTGTPFVSVNGAEIKHIGGTGVGGGTLDGLAKLLLQRRAWDLEAFAKRGKPRLDLTVNEVIGGPIGIVPPNATAANLGKVTMLPGTPKKEDVALSVIALVGESVGASAAFAAKSAGHNKIVFTGRVAAKNKFFRERSAAAAKIFGVHADYPKNGEYATAIGAALLA
jgi:type II pantothenate kinase